MGLSYCYHLYFPREAIEQGLKDLAEGLVPMEDRTTVTIIFPEGRKISLPSWSDLHFPDAPIFDSRTETMRRLRIALKVEVERAERRQFRNAMTDKWDNAVLPLQLALDLKLDQPGSFTQISLWAYTSSSSHHVSTDSFYHVMARILSANDGLCAILDYEYGLEASLRWLRDSRVILPQPIPRQCESLEEEFNLRTKSARFSSFDKDLQLMRRFDHAIKQWLMVF